jgi:hypothetical protein
MQRQIRLDKFEQVLPKAMREHGIDMWIVAVKENHYEPLWEDLGPRLRHGHRLLRVHRSRRRRIERAALGPSGYLLESPTPTTSSARRRSSRSSCARDPKRIGVNMSDEIGPADGLSYTMHRHL